MAWERVWVGGGGGSYSPMNFVNVLLCSTVGSPRTLSWESAVINPSSFRRRISAFIWAGNVTSSSLLRRGTKHSTEHSTV